MCSVSRTFGDVEDPVDALLTRIRGIGIHTLFDGVCRPGCRCTRTGVFLVCRCPHVEVFLVDQEDFQLDSASFRVDAG